MADSAPDFEKLLRILVEHDVEFILVGGLGAVLQGAPIVTFDVDIVHRRNQENIARLLTALRELDAYYRTQPEKRLRPRRSHLESDGHQLLMTKCGPLDVLGTVGKGRSFEDLKEESSLYEVAGFRFRVLELASLIQLKEELSHPKDRAVLELLREVLRRKPNNG